MQIEVTIHGTFTPEQEAAVKEVIKAVEVFVTSPNETATADNNRLQKLAGEARKLIVPPKPPKAK